MTLFVGPNGSGKSLALRELHHYAENGSQITRKVIERIVIAVPDDDASQRMCGNLYATWQHG
jgi:ribose 1,5-bisphosphokinase PhnN